MGWLVFFFQVLGIKDKSGQIKSSLGHLSKGKGGGQVFGFKKIRQTRASSLIGLFKKFSNVYKSFIKKKGKKRNNPGIKHNMSPRWDTLLFISRKEMRSSQIYHTWGKVERVLTGDLGIRLLTSLFIREHFEQVIWVINFRMLVSSNRKYECGVLTQ